MAGKYLDYKYAHNAYNRTCDRGRPTLKDDERFRNGYFHDNNIHKHDKSLGLNYDAVFEDAFIKLTILASDITDQ